MNELRYPLRVYKVERLSIINIHSIVVGQPERCRENMTIEVTSRKDGMKVSSKYFCFYGCPSVCGSGSVRYVSAGISADGFNTSFLSV